MEADQNSDSDYAPASESLTDAIDGTGQKTLITIDPNGIPIGEGSEKFSTRVGQLVRAHCPISYKDWRLVPKNYKQDVWNALMLEYEFNVPAELVQPQIEGSYSQKFRSAKHALRTEFLVGATKEEALAACPTDIDPDIWKGFVSNEYKEDMKKKRTQNAANKKKNTIRHRLGRRSYLNKNYILAKKEGIVVEDRAGSWMKAHENKDGTVHPTAVEKYEQIKAAKEKRKRMSEEGSGTNLAFDSDVLAEVFGPDDNKGFVRAYSSCISKKRAQHGALASSLIESNKSNASLEAIESLAKRVRKCMKTMMQQFQNQTATHATVGDGTLGPNTGSSEHRTSRKNLELMIEDDVPEDTNSGSRMSDNLYVNLLNREGVVVGTGYIVTGKDSEVCHGRKVLPDEKKVLVEHVDDINAPIPDPPQSNGHFTLEGFSEGDCLIWMASRLQRRS